MYFQAAKLLLFSQISKKKWKKHRKLFSLYVCKPSTLLVNSYCDMITMTIVICLL